MIGIIGAMQVEIDAILELMDNHEKTKINATDFYTGKLKGKDVVIMLSGIGKVSAAINTTLLFEHFNPDGIINVGTAGGLMDEQSVLDVVISTVVAHHDFDIVGSAEWPKGFDQSKTAYKAHQYYVEIVEKIAKDNTDKIWIGPIVSGDMFVNQDYQVDKIKREFPAALCAEMEAASIAQTCKYYDKPFVVIRSLSDITMHPQNEITFDEYVQVASRRSAEYCALFVESV